MNKRGALVLRDVMFMLITFAGLMALMSVVVYDMSNEYDNPGMTTDYKAGSDGEAGGGVGGLGDSLFGDLNKSVSTMGDNADEAAGGVGIITGIITGAGIILKQILLAPTYVGNALKVMLDVLRVPVTISTIIRTLVNLLIYVLIIFVIVSALLKGGKV